MCEDCCGHGHPEELKVKPEESSKEQIKEGHGDSKDHPHKDEDK